MVVLQRDGPTDGCTSVVGRFARKIELGGIIAGCDLRILPMLGFQRIGLL